MGLDSVLLPVVVADAEIVSQLHSGFLAGQSEQTGNKINCISVRLASETMETLVHLHAGILVIVKRADCHAMMWLIRMPYISAARRAVTLPFTASNTFNHQFLQKIIVDFSVNSSSNRLTMQRKSHII